MSAILVPKTPPLYHKSAAASTAPHLNPTRNLQPSTFNVSFGRASVREGERPREPPTNRQSLARHVAAKDVSRPLASAHLTGKGRLSAGRASPFTHRQTGDAISIRLSSAWLLLHGSLRRSTNGELVPLGFPTHIAIFERTAVYYGDRPHSPHENNSFPCRRRIWYNMRRQRKARWRRWKSRSAVSQKKRSVSMGDRRVCLWFHDRGLT